MFHSLDLSQQQQQQQQDATSLEDLTFDENNDIFMDFLSNCDYDYDFLSFDNSFESTTDIDVASVCIDLHFTDA